MEAADSVLDECKVAAEIKQKRKNSRLDKCGIPEEQLYLMQQQLIENVSHSEANFQTSLTFSVLKVDQVDNKSIFAGKFKREMGLC